MEPSGENSSTLTDDVTYSLPMGLNRIYPFAEMAARELDRVFRFRHRRMAEDLHRYRGESPGEGRTVLVTGATGLIGKRLVPLLRTLGYSVRTLTRGRQDGDTYHWDPDRGKLAPEALDGVDAVIHLAGENIAGGRWTEGRKKLLVESRLRSTRLLTRVMAKLSSRPEVFVSASGANFYGSGGGPKSENDPVGDGFLAGLCADWEKEAREAEKLDIRTVLMRTGVVLDPMGGALAKMLPPFLFGFGGRVGTGKQAFPWIAMDDLLDIYVLALLEKTVCGPVNAVHEATVSQIEFSQTLARVLKRPSVVPLPESMVNLLLGEMGQETLLADLNLVPGVLSAQSHAFRSASLEDALSFMLGKTNAP